MISDAAERNGFMTSGILSVATSLDEVNPGARLDQSQHILPAMAECVRLKPDVHSFHGNQQMSRIGG